MSLCVSESGGSSIPLLPEGSYAAICYMLVDIGLQKSEKFGNSSRKIIIGWEIAGEHVEIDGEEKPRVISARYTASLNEKSILRRDLTAWRGREFTEEELKNFNLRSIVGAPCLIQVVHKDSGGRKYANLAGIMRLPKGMQAPELTLDKMIFDIDECEQTDVDELPDWISALIKQSETYKARFEGIAPAQKTDFSDIENSDDQPF